MFQSKIQTQYFPMGTPEAVPKKTSKDLASAIYDDFKRKAIDEAKKRAVGQHVDYDTFRNMVLVAHLKPLQAPSQQKGSVMLPSWTFNADGAAADALQATEAPVSIGPAIPSEAPSTSGDFYRDWRRNCPTPDDKYCYLWMCGPATLRSIFKVEISNEVLKEVLLVLGSCWLSHAGAAEEGEAGAALREASYVLRVLDALASAGRFSLTLRLLGAGSKQVLQELFAQLEQALQAVKGAEELQAVKGAEELQGSSTEQAGGNVPEADLFDKLRAVYGVPTQL